MGEEKKEEVIKEEKKEEEKKEEEKKEPEKPQELVELKVDMHCQACARKVARALKGFQGVENVTTDCKASKVVVKGKDADPIKVCQRIQKKTGRKVELISPLPNPPQETKPEEQIKEEQPKPEIKKEEPPAVIAVVLEVRMHCDACAQALQKRIRKISGVESVETDLANDKVLVKGVVDPDKLVDDVYKKTGKRTWIVKEEPKEEPKKEEEKKDEDKKDEKQDDKKQEKEEEIKEDEEDKKTEIKKNEYFPPKYYMEYAYPTPEMFSDENPNACFVM